jgi:hypothetical protein
MRSQAISANGDFRVRVIAGTHAILMALDCLDHRREGFRGFAFKRRTGDGKPKWLRSLKVFRSIVPDPKALVDGEAQRFTTNEHPVQSFLWSDYTAAPGTTYRFVVAPMYGKPGALASQQTDKNTFEITTELEMEQGGHGVCSTVAPSQVRRSRVSSATSSRRRSSSRTSLNLSRSGFLAGSSKRVSSS